MIKINNQNITNLFFGTTPIKRVLINEIEVYSNGPSFYDEYLTFTALEDNCSIYYKQKLNNLPVEYSTDKITWTTTTYEANHLMTTLNAGDKLYIRGNNNYYCNSYSDNNANRFYGNKQHDISGNLMSLSYGDNFNKHSELPSTSTYSFAQLFENDTYLVNAKNLKLTPTTLYNGVYQEMFRGCTSLISIPELPATTLAEACYWCMFQNCSSLTTVKLILPATTLALDCYVAMFNGCTSLTDASNIILPATTIPHSGGQGCYFQMFAGCTSLTTAPKLPATNISRNGYRQMFAGCTSLTTAPNLPATALGLGCYWDMFNGCTSLTTAPNLPATTLANSCYLNMFQNCTSLIKAPELLASTLVNSCYQNMFNGCTSLNYILCLATDISASNCTSNWVNNVSSTGTFIKANNMTSWTTGANGIPSDWDINAGYEYKYLTLEALETGNITFSIYNNAVVTDVSYRVNSGTWNTTSNPQGTTITVPVTQGDKVEWKGNGSRWSTYYDDGSIFGGTVTFNVYGNIMSMIYDDLFMNKTTMTGDNGFANMFKASKVINAENLILPATVYGVNCCTRMFRYCTQLTTPPKEIPNITQAGDWLFDYMFEGCSVMTKTPILRTVSLRKEEYAFMFKDCTSLQYIECYATSFPRGDETYHWASGVAATGTFVKHVNASWSTGVNGIPSGWTVISKDPEAPEE